MSSSQIWVRILSGAIGSASYALIVYTLVVLAWSREVGHKRLLWLQAAFFASRSVTLALNAWGFYSGRMELSSWFIAGSSLISLIFALYLFGARQDLFITLRTSEAQHRVLVDKLADMRQVSLLLKDVATFNLKTADRLAGVGEEPRCDGSA